jgi:uncharacterized protein
MAGKDHGRPAWQLLVDVDAVSPETVASTLAYPYVRRRVRDALASAQPAGAMACRGVLAATAIAAAVRAGHPGSLDVPVVEGALCLPGLGVLALPEASVARVSSSVRPGEFAVHPDLGRSWTSTEAGRAERWRSVRLVSTGGPGLWFDDVDPARDCYAHPVADRLSSAERDAWVAMLEQAWSSIRSVAPQLATALDMTITTVTPLASPSHPDPPVIEAPDAVFGAVAIPMAEPDATAVALVEHAARSIILAAHRAFGVADAHQTLDVTSQAPSTLADAYAVAAVLRLAERRRRSGEPVDDGWVTARQKQLRRHLDEAARDDRWTKLGRLVLDHIDAVR